MPDFVSILLPFHNALNTLPDCLDSIQAQDHVHWELVAVNDHCHDGSANWLRQRALKDSRIRVLDNPGSGLVAALNHGLSACSHELVLRMDADDLMRPQRLSRQLAHFERCQPWRAKRRLVDPSSREAALLTRRAHSARGEAK